MAGTSTRQTEEQTISDILDMVKQAEERADTLRGEQAFDVACLITGARRDLERIIAKADHVPQIMRLAA